MTLSARLPVQIYMRSLHELVLELCITHWCLRLNAGLTHAPTRTAYSALVNIHCHFAQNH